MRWKNRLWVASALTLVACGSFDGIEDGRAVARAKPVSPPPPPVAEPVKVGEPYLAEGQSFTPRDEVNYDEVGYASWYGDERRGQNTGNGEAFNPDGVSAAHRTLPMPSFVEVTNLDTGRTILVRINDRGPFARDRIIDLSSGAARQLGVAGQGHVPVRVRRVNPPEYERSALKNGNQATERLPTPPGLLNALKLKLKDAPAPKADAPAAAIATARKPTVRPVKPVVKVPPPPKTEAQAGADFPPPGAKPTAALPTPRPVVKPMAAQTVAGSWFVQIGAFGNAASAKSVAAKAGGQAVAAGALWRVRTGPYESEGAAQRALGGLRAKGYRDARITH